MGALAFSLLLHAGLATAALGVAAHAHSGEVARAGMLFVWSAVQRADGARYDANRRGRHRVAHTV